MEFGIWCLYTCIVLLFWYRTGWVGIFDACVAMAICYFCYRWGRKIPGVSTVMIFIGKHSMNLFMMHTFIYSYYFKNFIYSFKHWTLILLVLLVVTLLLSIIFEKIKVVIGYNKLEKRCSEKLAELLSKIEMQNE